MDFGVQFSSVSPSGNLLRLGTVSDKCSADSHSVALQGKKVSGESAYDSYASPAFAAERKACIVIYDITPRFLLELFEEVFEPWFWVDGSRNRATGDSDLELTDAENIAELCGVPSEPCNRPEGDCRASICFKR